MKTVTFLQVRTTYSISLEAIAALAGTSVEDIYYLEAGCHYPQETITRVLAALSQLTGESHTLETIDGIYITKNHEQHEAQPLTNTHTTGAHNDVI
jgi:hypothetical protein